MDNQIEKIMLEIEKETAKKVKIEEKLKQSNEKLKQLEAKKTELENAQIVSTIRELNIKPEELQGLLASLKPNSSNIVGSVEANSNVEEEAV